MSAAPRPDKGDDSGRNAGRQSAADDGTCTEVEGDRAIGSCSVAAPGGGTVSRAVPGHARARVTRAGSWCCFTSWRLRPMHRTRAMRTVRSIRWNPTGQGAFRSVQHPRQWIREAGRVQ